MDIMHLVEDDRYAVKPMGSQRPAAASLSLTPILIPKVKDVVPDYGETLFVNEGDLLRRHDELAMHQVIMYSNDARVVKLNDNGFPVHIVVSSTLSGKPALGEKLDIKFKSPLPSPDSPLFTHSPHPLAAHGGCLPLRGDIDVTGHEIGIWNGTHLLAYNKFSAYRPHLLLLTLSPSHKQTSDLNSDDIAATWSLLRAFNRDYIAMFNCGQAAGCSRIHKHMQLIPRPTGHELWPDMVDWARPPLPFAFRKEHVRSCMSAREVTRVVREMLRRARTEARLGDDEHFAHNLLITRHWVVLVPRSASAFDGVSINAAGFLGMTWVSSDKIVRDWKKVGALRVLEGCGTSPKREE